MMLRALILLSFLLFFPFMPATAAEKAEKQVFLEAIADMPLMTGLTETKEAGFTFDKPEGRIIETVASGNVPEKAAKSFYRTSLPKLGWKNIAADVWQRDHEILRIDFQRNNNVTYVRFNISPEK